ncbi:hypothetical protein V3C99_018153 [Haemonchus contortus]
MIENTTPPGAEGKERKRTN